MKFIRSSELEYVPASHEDPEDPGVLKKVLFERDDLVDGRVQMVNWAFLPVGNSFAPHYHEDMQEVFILISGDAEMTVGDEILIMKPGHAVEVPIKEVHYMKNVGKTPVEYIVFGIALEQGGKTVTV